MPIATLNGMKKVVLALVIDYHRISSTSVRYFVIHLLPIVLVIDIHGVAVSLLFGRIGGRDVELRQLCFGNITKYQEGE